MLIKGAEVVVSVTMTQHDCYSVAEKIGVRLASEF